MSDERKAYIGGSDIGAILGVSKWATPLDVWEEKTGNRVKVHDPYREKLFRRGKLMEPVVVEMFAQERGVTIIERNKRYIDRYHSFMACEVDAEAMVDAEHCNVEVKTSHPFAANQWGEEGSDEIDVSYAAQAMWGLGITGRQRCIFAVLIGSDNLVTYEVLRDDETVRGMRAKAVEFWTQHVLTNTPPPPKTLDDVYTMFRRRPPSKVEATPEVAALIQSMRVLKERERIAAEAVEALQYEIGLVLLGAEALENPTAKDAGKHVVNVGGKPALWVAYQEQTRIDSDALREKYPEAAAECSKVSRFFTFNLKKGKP